MVKIDKKSRRRMIEENYSLKQNKYLNRHFLHIFILSMVALSVALYFFLLSVEEREYGNTQLNQVDSKNNEGVPRSTNEDTSKRTSALPAFEVLEDDKPFLMYGTAWKKERTATLVQEAVEAGFRFIDTACQPKHYNEALVGEGWTAGAESLGLERKDIFLQTKFTPISGQDPNNIPYDELAPLSEQVQQSLRVSLANLKTPYLDSLVLHSPLHTIDETMIVWREFEDMVDKGLVKRIGISNCYDYHFFTSLYEQARIKPSVLQNRFYAESNFDTELRRFCKEHNIWYQSFWTLTANRGALATDEAREWAASKGLTPQTLLYAFLLSLGYPKPLDGTTSPVHMKEDVALVERMQKGDVVFDTEEDQMRFAKLLGMPDL